jgi:hypothetical protein
LLALAALDSIPASPRIDERRRVIMGFDTLVETVGGLAGAAARAS